MVGLRGLRAKQRTKTKPRPTLVEVTVGLLFEEVDEAL